SCSNHPNMDISTIESLITPRTKAIVPVHYAGVSVDLKLLSQISAQYQIPYIEDAAQAIDSYNYQFGEPRALGSFGALSAFSFHETKNIISGEGGMLVINDDKLAERAEIIWEKGTNRSAFFRGEIDKYGWVDIGSSFLPSEIISAFLYAQLLKLKDIQEKRKSIWSLYNDLLGNELEKFGIQVPFIPEYADNNAHMFYLVCRNLNQRERLIQALKSKGIHAVFHYQSLHKSPFYSQKHDHRMLTNSDTLSDTLLRLPLYYELDAHQIIKICHIIIKTLHNHHD
ncbi:MAG: DegT/DnrJ/EryC1/StrS family aminotransferase, partial [Bacteroidetes bacterium]|nr:DegT/DnrJ/EryC1/StrS family aminotransferase [Bacteroidota bacterium]